MVSKVPAKLAGLLKTAIKNGAITVVGEQIVSISIDQLEAPLKEFFNNLPEAAELISDGVVRIAEDGYRTVESIAEEAINEAKTIGETIGHEFEHAGKVVVKEIEVVGKDIEEAGKKVGSFFKGILSRL